MKMDFLQTQKKMPKFNSFQHLMIALKCQQDTLYQILLVDIIQVMETVNQEQLTEHLFLIKLYREIILRHSIFTQIPNESSRISILHLMSLDLILESLSIRKDLISLIIVILSKYLIMLITKNRKEQKQNKQHL